MKDKPRKLTIPERVLEFFDKHVTEAHFSAICSFARITEEEFRQNVAAARDLRVEPGFRLTPIYREAGVRRPGWWTHRPTEHIVAWSIYESISRNLGEQERQIRVYGQMKFDPDLSSLRRNLRFAVADLLHEHATEMGVTPEMDYVITAVNEADEAGQLAVHKGGER